MKARVFAAVALLGLLISQIGAVRAQSLPDVHCVMEVTFSLPNERSSEESEADVVDETIDPIPGQPELCVLDEDTAWDLAGRSGTRVGKFWSKNGFEGSTVTLMVPPRYDEGDGCADGDRFSKSTLGRANNDLESGKGFSGCNTITLFDYKFLKGTQYHCASPCYSFGNFENRASSLMVRP